jgi:hypothetical protein
MVDIMKLFEASWANLSGEVLDEGILAFGYCSLQTFVANDAVNLNFPVQSVECFIVCDKGGDGNSRAGEIFCFLCHITAGGGVQRRTAS